MQSGAANKSFEDIGFVWNNEEQDEFTLELTPMIDVTFLLLIFFMVTATFAIHEVKEISIAKGKGKPVQFSIDVDKNQRIFLENEEVSLLQLKDRLKEKIIITNQQNKT